MSSDDADDGAPMSPEEEATMQAEIELALEPYRKIAPASMLPMLRETLENALRTHPVPRKLLRGFAKRQPVMTSASGPIDGAKLVEKKDGKEGA